jgi:hypothetical protein
MNGAFLFPLKESKKKNRGKTGLYRKKREEEEGGIRKQEVVWKGIYNNLEEGGMKGR